MTDRVSVITGGSRGIGAATARILAERGSDIVINYRAKEGRAHAVAAEIDKLGRRCVPIRADLSVDADIVSLARTIRSEFTHVDYLILNAAGGLERDKDQAYAYSLNVTANARLLDEILPAMSPEATIIYVTSHPSHFYGRKPIMSGYQRVASTKRAAEDMLRDRIPEMSAAGIRLIVVSGDLIEGTINAKLMLREYPDLMKQREKEVGPLPTVHEFATAIADAAMNAALATGETIFVGSTSWETYDAIHAREQSVPNERTPDSVKRT